MHMNLGIPTARAAHGMCTIGRNIVIFGGRDTEKRRNDLHVYNIGELVIFMVPKGERIRRHFVHPSGFLSGK